MKCPTIPLYKKSIHWYKNFIFILLIGIVNITSSCRSAEPGSQSAIPENLQSLFSSPTRFENQFGKYDLNLENVSGEKEWHKRREKILEKWHESMGEWPDIIENPTVEYLDTLKRNTITQYKIRLEVAEGWTRDAYLLVPDLEGPLPAALVLYYEPETGVGLSSLELRDFGLQLAERGFVTLSLGSDANSNYYPDKNKAQLQPLSMLAYMAANTYHSLANLPIVDPERIGVVGHSYGGKWAMFASALYDKFALGVWSDGGIVFDETRPNVNYWEPWYLGYEQGTKREPGLPTDDNPRTGAYKQMIEDDMDLHELLALMAPRPFLVSGGAEDTSNRWIPLNNIVKLNKKLGFENRLAMHNREGHGPTEESNEFIYRFFEHFLKE